ncbi:HNH endonuclease [Brevibacillus choshinensis]|uniref:HNH endonuclease n=1 Tax=Brevibacillus choshinensis TaxID=54911 RepID=UPI002E1B86E4|nr:HNH endonuclease domain-containing protein [Brevibacillus choshinensis]
MINVQFLDSWLGIIRKCSFDNTYKMAWAKSLTELSLEYEPDKHGSEYATFSLEDIAKKIIRYYWEQTLFFDLIQGSNPNKPPEILTQTKKLISVYQETTSELKPIKFYKTDIENKCPNEYEQTIKSIVRTLKKDVSHRFLNLEGKVTTGIYDYSLNHDVVYMSVSNVEILKANYLLVFEAINYRWSQMLENFNHSPRICKKVRVIDEDSIRRKPLKGFMKYISHENPQQRCFICTKPIVEETPAIDHVIPWSYLYADDLWNLVFTHQTCNSSKSNIMPDEFMVQKLEKRNLRLLSVLEEAGITDKAVTELRLAIEKELVRKFWISCQG